MSYYYIYATFKANDREASIASASCTIYKNGSTVAAAGTMTKMSDGIFYYAFDYEQAGTYMARCIGSRTGDTNVLDTKTFDIIEQIRPQYVDIASIQSRLNSIISKLGTTDVNTIEQLLGELTSYSTGTSPLPGLIPVTAMNTKLNSYASEDSVLIDNQGVGITGAKVNFFPALDTSNPAYITYSFNGYWGTYLPVGNYLMRVEKNGEVLVEDELEVQG